MRVLTVSHYRGIVGGVESYLHGLFPLLRSTGYELAVVTEKPAAPDQVDILAGVPGTKAWVAGDPASVVKAAADWNPDIVYFHGVIDPEVGAALTARYSVVHFAHVYSGSCISGTKCHAVGPRPCSRSLGPACLALYLPRRCGGLNPIKAFQTYRNERRRQKTFQEYRAVVVASRHMAAEVERNGVPVDRIHTVPLFPTGIVPDPDPPTPRPRTGRLLFVGRITNLKGWSHLVQAIPRVASALGRPLTLVVAGDGPDREKFEAAASRARIPTEFLGWIDPERREAEMRAADLLAVPSVWPEPFGLVGIEAGCVGLPAVAYAVGGIPDWLEPGVSGESAPGERPDPRELAEAMVRALSSDAHLHSLRVGAWESSRRFTPKAHLDLLLPILEAAAC